MADNEELDELRINFDIEMYLDEREIHYDTEGRNVTAGWANTACPFCGDKSNHLGINLTSKNISCWKCATKDNIFKLIMEYEDCSFGKALAIARTYQNYLKEHVQRETVYAEKFIVPTGVTDKPTKNHIDYLKNRDFNPNHIINTFGLLFGGPIGTYKHRIIIPYFLNKKIVTFSARSIAKEPKVKYLLYPFEKSILDPKRTIYNIDSVQNTIMIVEGPTDAWRLGAGAGATSGVQFTSYQLAMLQQKQIKNGFLIFDGEAQEEAHKMASQLNFMDHVEVIDIGEDDPGSMTDRDVLDLKKFLFTN